MGLDEGSQATGNNTAKQWEAGIYLWSLGQLVSGPEVWLLSRLLHGAALTCGL